jgi:hypothetical protein
MSNSSDEINNDHDEQMIEIKNILDSLNDRIRNLDTIIFKIDKIEESQGQIHDAIYDQNNGVFAKLSELNVAIVQNHLFLEKDIQSLKTIQDYEILESKNIDPRLGDLEARVTDLTKTNSVVTGVYKWVLVAFGGGLVTLMFKFIYNVVTNHIKFM